MSTVTLLEAKERLADLVREAEMGESVILTRDGEPVAEIKPTPRRSERQPTLEERMAALEAYKKEHGIESFFGPIPEDFDDPLPEDILIRPLPPLE